MHWLSVKDKYCSKLISAERQKNYPIFKEALFKLVVVKDSLVDLVLKFKNFFLIHEG